MTTSGRLLRRILPFVSFVHTIEVQYEYDLQDVQRAIVDYLVDLGRACSIYCRGRSNSNLDSSNFWYSYPSSCLKLEHVSRVHFLSDFESWGRRLAWNPDKGLSYSGRHTSVGLRLFPT